MQLTKSNNWLKMHGYPMRRKDYGKRRGLKRYLIFDEFPNFFKDETEEVYRIHSCIHSRASTLKNNRNIIMVEQSLEDLKEKYGRR